MSRITRKQLSAGVLGMGLAFVAVGGQVSAQTTGTGTGTGASTGTGVSTGTGADSATTTARTTNRDDSGFNPGWLGLLGLAGLAGLMPKKNHTVTTTHRTGDATTR